MNRTKTTGLVVGVFGLLAIFAADAAAQAPTLTVTAVGPSVTILWTPLPGASGYTLAIGTAPGASNIASVNLPASITRIVVKAPEATYYLRVRGFVGSIVGPYSNEASVTVSAATPPPQAPCVQPAAPTATATTSGLAVTVNWNNVGALGYRVVYGRSAGASELVQEVGGSTTSHTLPVGMAGTFYVYVQAVNACGSTNSGNVAFTLGGGSTNPTPPTGARTPNPPPGQFLPVPSYGAAVVDDMARRYPGELSRSCKTNHEFLFLLLHELRKYDSRWGLNWKRGDTRQGMSSDIVSYNPTDQPDEGNPQVYIFDVIGAECERNYPTFIDQTPNTWAFRGDPACGSGTYCTKWTLQPYLQAGFPAVVQEQE